MQLFRPAILPFPRQRGPSVASRHRGPGLNGIPGSLDPVRCRAEMERSLRTCFKKQVNRDRFPLRFALVMCNPHLADEDCSQKRKDERLQE